MTASGAKELFRQLTKDFFGDGYMVIFSNQSRIPKPEIPLVTILPGNVRRHQAAVHLIDDEGSFIGHYESRLTFTVDLFTRGSPIEDEYGDVVAYENNAMDLILNYADYLNSPKCVEWCQKNDVSILIESDAQDLTDVVNDNNYEYRARQEVEFYFVQKAETEYGNMGSFDEVIIEEEPE